MGLSLGKNCCPLKVLQGRCLRAGLGGSSVDFELVGPDVDRSSSG